VRLVTVDDFDHTAAETAKQRLLANLATPRLRDAITLYFDPAQPFAGRTFDSLGRNPPNEIIADDLFAVTLLDVRWTPLAVRALLGKRVAQVGNLLGGIDNHTDMWADEAGKQLAAVEPLWELLCSLPGVRDTRASKLLARKRPRLIPVTDSIIVSAVSTPGQTWLTLRHCFQDANFRESVKELQPRNAESATLLRVFDVAIWMLFSRSKTARKARRDAGVTS
jgi:hypothetical protein